MNGRVVDTFGTSVTSEDAVALDGRRVVLPTAFRYLVLHKPVRVVTTMRDPEGRRTVAALLPSDARRVVPVGRLDYDTSGVLLMTDDGDLAFVLTHPRFGVDKTYRALVRGMLTADIVRALRGGVPLSDGVASPARVRVVSASRSRSEIDITIHEGRNRQVRRMLEGVGHPVVSLVRLRFGPIALGELAPGAVREATSREVRSLRQIAVRSTHQEPAELA